MSGSRDSFLPFRWATLTHRAVLRLHGPDARDFLQGLITCDVLALTPGALAYGCLLTPQGKFLFDLFLQADLQDPHTLWLDVEAERASIFLALLQRYRLRARATLELAPDRCVVAAWGEPPRASAPSEFFHWAEENLLKDLRLADLGWRSVFDVNTREVIAQRFAPYQAAPADYHAHRLHLGVSESPRELIPERSIILEHGLHELKALSWTKGCYLGQELMARTYHRGLIRKRTMLVIPRDGKTFAPALTATVLRDPITHTAVGEVLTALPHQALAMVRLESLSEALREHGRAAAELMLEGSTSGQTVDLVPPAFMNVSDALKHFS